GLPVRVRAGRPAGQVTLAARAFLLIALLIVAALLASLQIYRVYEREPRSRELAQQTVSTINLTRAALVNADPVLRRQLLIELNETEGLRVYPVTASEKTEPLPDDPLLERVVQKARGALGGPACAAPSGSRRPAAPPPPQSSRTPTRRAPSPACTAFSRAARTRRRGTTTSASWSACSRSLPPRRPTGSTSSPSRSCSS